MVKSAIGTNRNRIFIARYNDDVDQPNWIRHLSYVDYGATDLYVASIYFCVTTIVTVGYGDISAFSMSERIFCILIMLIGVVSFSYITGALASMVADQDSKEAALNEKMIIL